MSKAPSQLINYKRERICYWAFLKAEPNHTLWRCLNFTAFAF